MKYVAYYLLALSFAFSACDKCKDVVCVNGDCNKGNCDCYPWYEGEKCEDEMREKFYGRYNGTWTIDGEAIDAYTILEKAGNELNKIDWDGSYLLLTSSTDFTIPEQLITYDGQIYVLRGPGGTLKFNQLKMEWSLSFQGTTVYCQFSGYNNKSANEKGSELNWGKVTRFIK